jgi:hypothetical protein
MPTAATQPVAQSIASHVPLALPSHWPAQGDLLEWCRNMTPGTAAIMVVLGVVYLLFGWYMFRALITLNAALLGAYLGACLGERTHDAIAGALIGGFTFAAVTWPLMKWAVAIMGGIFGALLGASIWREIGLQPEFCWAGGLSGLILFGMLSFVIFRGSVITYTSLQGAVMLIFGAMGLLYKYQSVGTSMTDGMNAKPFILPAAIFIPAVFGLIYQQMNYPAGDAKKK